MTNPASHASSGDEFGKRLGRLRSDLLVQSERVYELVQRAVECAFELDVSKALAVVADDEAIDRGDIEIERASIPLLAMGETDEYRIRSILTVVKLNNELERIADCAVNIAEVVRDAQGELDGDPAPAVFRVMANSVLGMVRDANRAFAGLDVELAGQVLRFDDTVDRFKTEIFLDAERQVAAGTFRVTFAFRLRTITAQLERIADHATNICEQVIYLQSGKTVRHTPEGWSEPELPA